jgi:chemotaxis protein MotB
LGNILRRRVDTEISLNHERWLISYSDFVTLLFALFVVLYSISQVNENKYKDLTEAMNKVFHEPKRSIKPIQVGEIARAINLANNSTNVLSHQISESYPLNIHGQAVIAPIAELPQLSDQFVDKFSSFIDDEIIQVNNNELWLEISLSNSILFPLGSAKANDSAQKVLFEIADILKPFNNPIQVEGYTDNLPVSSSQFPSNWELSSARATAIVKILVEGGVVPARLAAVGYGEHQPITENDTPEGREKNRRVVLMIAREKQDRPKVKIADAINEALNFQTIESVQVNPQPGSESLEATDRASLPNPSLDKSNAPINDGTIVPVETEKGGLLFSSDPDL